MTEKRYPVYKPTGIEWFGDAPAHWEVKRLKHLIDKIEQGWSPQCHNQAAEEGEWGVLKVGCVNSGIFDPSENKALPSDLEPKLEYVIRAGDILISRANTKELVGSAAKVKAVDAKLLLCDKLFRIVTSGKVHDEYLIYTLRSAVARHQYEKDATGTSGSMQNIGQDTIKNLLVSLPPLKEQGIIADFLDGRTAQIDVLITKKQALLKLLDEKRTALITQAVTKGLNPDAPLKLSGIDGLGDIPAHWEVKRLKNLVTKVGSGVTPKGGSEVYVDEGIMFLRSQNIHFNGLRLEDVKYISEETHEAMANSQVSNGDVLLNITGASIGRVTTYTLHEEANVNQHVCIIRPVNNSYSAFIRYLLTSTIGQHKIFAGQVGTSREGLTFEEIKNFQFPIPPVEEVGLIVSEIEKNCQLIDRLAEQNTLAINKLKEYRSSLITHAVTGKIDVRQYAPEPYAHEA
ncbi:restriction endonuclease subunit S [Cesiribacter andamanensis]|uniref:Type I restriction enzyme EcoKI specificity protein n=1 Tax=Cesiribacter andamanensis AMV16 TaxID=1279009 RepID=M7NBX0_9BACT|nr:restriction endonuclease subunit S [Cesiribacter andamanensis]EMR04681.1 Type I restriction enzyme EcoKI specificity protein [Cesiribacter andamanensis AMV16]